MGFFANTKSDIKVFPDRDAEDLYRNALPKVRFTPGDTITFRSEFIQDLVYKHHNYLMWANTLSFPKSLTVYCDMFARTNYNEALNIVSVLKTITSNIYEYLNNNMDPDYYIPKPSPVTCEEYSDIDWMLRGGAYKRCIQCAFFGSIDENGNHKSRICDRLDCDGMIFKKCE